MAQAAIRPPLDVCEEEVILSLDAFVRSVEIRRETPLAVFAGAGASISSGLPSAEMCIWEWKRSIFLTKNPGLENQFSELSLHSIRRRIQQFLDRHGNYPPNGAPEEYEFYIEQCFPISDDRRAYFQKKVRESRPHVGYHLLCYLAEANFVQSVWSTNFDGLAARAAATFDLSPIEVGIDCQSRLLRPPRKGDLLCVSLHGDYRYDALKNTRRELQTQEKALCNALSETARTVPLIVTGYSGRDRSVMDALRTAYTRLGSGVLYWCGFGDGDPSETVADLIRHARNHGNHAYYVPSLGFDDLMRRISLHCLQDERREAVRHCIATLTPADVLRREPFQLRRFSSTTLIKSNAFGVECPAEVFEFDLKVWPSQRVWRYLRTVTGQRPLIAVPFRKVLALGTIEEIRNAFGDNLKGPIKRTPVSTKDFRNEFGAIVSLFRQALVRSMAEVAGLNSDGNKLLWRPDRFRTFQYDNSNYSIHEAVLIFLRQIGNAQYVVLKPSLKVCDHSGVEAPNEIANPIKLSILGYQHNKPFNQAINRWRKTLFF